MVKGILPLVSYTVIVLWPSLKKAKIISKADLASLVLAKGSSPLKGGWSFFA